MLDAYVQGGATGVGPVSALPGRLETCSPFPGLAWGLPSGPGGPRHRRCSVRVHLSPDHPHDLLLDFGVLSIDIGVAHLAVFVPARVGRGCRGGPGGLPQVPVRRVQLGLTQRRSGCRHGPRRGRPRCCRVSAGPWR